MSRQESRGKEEESKQEQAGQEAERQTVGRQLRQLRKEKGLTIRDVALETNISASNLVAIEHENYHELPSATFVRGQVAIYANLLGINGAETARGFIAERDRQLTDKRKTKFSGEDNPISPKKLAEPAHVSSATLAGCLLLTIVLAVAAFCFYTGWNPFSYFMSREETTTAAALPESAAEPTPEDGETAAPPAEEAGQEAAGASSSTAEQSGAAPAGN